MSASYTKGRCVVVVFVFAVVVVFVVVVVTDDDDDDVCVYCCCLFVCLFLLLQTGTTDLQVQTLDGTEGAVHESLDQLLRPF